MQMADPARMTILTDRIHTFNDGGRTFVLCHYPMASWEGSNRGSYMLHGHSHGGMDEQNATRFRLDVGVSARSTLYAPISIDEVHTIMRNRKETMLLKEMQK
jgi:calcineurin-like phosphoesterase family protein